MYKEGYSSPRERQTVTIEVGKTARVEIKLKAVPRITGVVRDPNGQPVARAAMKVFPRGQNAKDSDKEGRFEILWNPERWGNQEPQPVLVVRHVRRNLAAAVEIDEETKTFDVNMTAGIVFTGAVIDPNGEPISDAKINVSLTISGHGMTIGTADVTTDQEGQYEYKAIPAGQQYTISAQADRYGQSYVKVDADDAVNNRLEIKPLILKVADMNISGIVVDDNDKPVANVEVTVSGQGQQYRHGITNDKGKFIIDKLCEGQVQVSVNFQRIDTISVPVYGNVSANAGDTDVTVVVAPPGTRQETKHVITGRVVLDGAGDVREVTAQMQIGDNGYFTTETKDIVRPIGFRMHGYAPYDLQLKGLKGDQIDVGTIHMTPLGQDQLVGLKGKVVLEDNGNPSGAVVYLSVANGPINTWHGGTSGCRHCPRPIRIQVSGNGLIEASGFSPISYYCRVTAPGYLEKVVPIEFNAGQTFDLGTITLEKPRQIELSYIVSERPPFDFGNLKTITVPAGTKWKVADTGVGYGWDLEFAQDKGSIIMKHSYGPCYLRDLGKGEIADYVNVDETKIGQQQPQNLKAKNEHIYLLHQVTWKRWVLFKIIIE